MNGKQIVLTESQVRRAIMGDSSEGVCLACGNIQSNVEPDAENYKCEDCGAFEVMGIENALVRNRIQIKD